MIPTALLPYKAWLMAVLLAAVAAAGAGGALAGWAVQGWRKDAEIAGLKLDRAKNEAADATQALSQYKTSATAISEAASSAQTANANTTAVLRTIRQELKNAKPLPPDCRPDAERLRKRNAAISAYNDAAAGRVPRSPVQDD